MNRLVAMSVAAALLPACVGGDVFVDLGPPDLSPRLDMAVTDRGPPADFTVLPDLIGYQVPPDPFMPGTPRLSLSAFYEGGASEVVAIDNTTTHLYIYPSGNTLVIADDTMDKAEGYNSAALTVAGGLGWFGVGVHWDKARDISAYKALHLALKSTAGSMSDVVVGMNSPMANPQTAKLNARNYGYANDGAWHHLVIPLSDFAGANPNPVNTKEVAAPLVLLNAGVVGNGDVVKVDDVYFE